MATANPPVESVRIGPLKRPARERTLGDEVCLWAYNNLQQPDGPNAGAPWQFTREQALFVLNWYAIDDKGRFVYRAGMLRRMKGWGKDPVAAVLAAVEFVGPCRFGGFDSYGIPIAVAHPAAWIQVAAVSRDQTRNTMTLFPGLFSPNTIAEHRIDLGKEIIYAHSGRVRIESVTSSPRSLEGGRSTFTIKNETQHWVKANDGHAMADVIARNAAKSRDGASRVLAISNAHAPGEYSDAEADYVAYLRDPTGFLYDSVEASEIEPAEMTDPEPVRRALSQARGDSYWLDLDRLTAEVIDPHTSEAMARRYYFNQIAASEDKAFSVQRWDELAMKDYKVQPGSRITLGFDGSETRDHTALIGTEVATKFQWVLGYWEPEYSPNSNEVRIPVLAVDAVVKAAFETFDVWRMNADPFYWSEWVALWAGRYNEPGREIVVSYNTVVYKRMAFDLQEYKNAMTSGDLSHDNDPRFRSAIANAHRREQGFYDDKGEKMWTIQKEHPDSALKIDAAMAGCLSYAACLAAIEEGVLESETEGSVWFA